MVLPSFLEFLKLGEGANMKIKIFLIVSTAICFSACAPTYRDTYLKDAQDKGFNKKQQLASYGYSFRPLFTEESSGTVKIAYWRLSKTRVREKLDSLLEDMDSILSYTDEGNYRYVDAWGLRPQLEHKEKVLEAIRARVRLAELQDQFNSLIGEIPRNEKIRERVFGYDDRKIFFENDLTKNDHFSLNAIESAKKDGTLKLIEEARASLKRQFDRKEQNPANREDENDFVWKLKAVDLQVKSYKILDNEKPDNNNADYIEMYRIPSESKPEIWPAVRIFMFNDRNKGVMIIDVDKKGESGHGIPDLIEPTTGQIDAKSLLKNDALMALVYTEKKKNRTPPKQNPVFVEIARVGEGPKEYWEIAKDKNGWTVPIEYKNPQQSNYNIKLVFAKVPPKEEDLYYQIKYVKKEWTFGGTTEPSIGGVVEYYRSKPPYGRRNLVEARVLHQENTKKVSLGFENGTQEIIQVLPGQNKFIEDKPVMIDYSVGQKRWRIKRDENSSVFMKKREILPSGKDSTGIYNEMEIE